MKQQTTPENTLTQTERIATALRMPKPRNMLTSEARSRLRIMRSPGVIRYIRTLGLAIRFVIQLWWLKRTSFLHGSRQREAASALYTKQAKKFSQFAIHMGGLIVKLGQFMSVRIDLLPKEYIDELSRLQDCLPALPTQTIIDVIEAELGKPLDQIYADFDREPLAAASLGQVHRATLPDGKQVAVKVLRPGIEDLVTTDLRSIRAILRLFDRWFRLSDFIDLDVLDADFSTTFTNELDYILEAHNAETFQLNLLWDPHVDIPQIFWESTTHKVLTMEFMDGVRIDNLTAMDARGIDRKEVAKNLMGIFYEMVLDDGFYHADPHPGNIFVRQDGVIQLIDFGMVGSITSAARHEYGQLVLGLVRRDADAIVSAMKDLGFFGPGADTRKLTNLMGPYIDEIAGGVTSYYTTSSFVDSVMSGRTNITVDEEILEQLREFIFTQPITLPGQTTFLGKSLITLLGLSLRLDPDIDLFATAAPYVTSSSKLRTAYDTLTAAAHEGIDLAKQLFPTAQRLVSVVQKLDDGSLEVELTARVQQQLIQSQKAQTRRIIRAIAAAAAFLAVILGIRRR